MSPLVPSKISLMTTTPSAEAFLRPHVGPPPRFLWSSPNRWSSRRPVAQRPTNTSGLIPPSVNTTSSAVLALRSYIDKLANKHTIPAPLQHGPSRSRIAPPSPRGGRPQRHVQLPRPLLRRRGVDRAELGVEARRAAVLHHVLCAVQCINQIVATRLHHGSITTSTPSTRRRLDGVPLGVFRRSIRSARSRFRRGRT